MESLSQAAGTVPLDVPDWDEAQMEIARQALNRLALLGVTTDRMFGI